MVKETKPNNLVNLMTCHVSLALQLQDSLKIEDYVWAHKTKLKIDIIENKIKLLENNLP